LIRSPNGVYVRMEAQTGPYAEALEDEAVELKGQQPAAVAGPPPGDPSGGEKQNKAPVDPWDRTVTRPPRPTPHPPPNEVYGGRNVEDCAHAVVWCGRWC